MKKNPGILPILLTTFLIVHGTFIRAQVTSLTNTENTVKGFFKKKSKPAKVDSTQGGSGGGGTAAAGGAANAGTAGANGASAGPVTLTAYANYDFVPGEQV